ncbi:YSIRK-type signal peptide-containing protein, partial [Streptococcus gordonii]|uniref:YSIRK-type signal peptide-containing protein n=1 Tax=Streptococcus gordonii TaxID=1302 RepID=UPI002285281D
MKRKEQDFRKEKYLRYSIRKYSFGAASVAIAAGLMFLGNGVVSATEVQGSDTTVTVTKSPATPAPTDKLESDLATVRSEVVTPPTTVLAEKPESPSTAVKPEVATPATAEKEDKIVEAKKADKTALTKKVVELEAKVASAKKADATAIVTANEVLTAAKAVLANETAKQADIDAELAKVEALITVVVESDEAGKQVEETATTTAVKPVATTATEKAVEESKKVLEQVTSEAEVTNVLADEAVRRNKVEGASKAAIEAAVVNNKEAIAEAKKVLTADNVTAQQINTQLSRLNDSILAVYDDLKKAGVGKDGNFGVALAAQDFYAEEGSNTTHASETNASNHTGKDTYTIPVQEIKLITGTDATGLEIEVYSNQRTGEDTNAGNGMHTEQGGKTGHNNKGRVDYPLTPDAAKKLAEEAPLWRNKLRADGSRISNAATSIYSANGGYEYLATEIYGYGYEQGVDRVYIKGLKDRIAVTEKAKQAGWSLTSVTPTNLVPGVTYDEATDTIQGKVVAGIENGVYDLRFNITATNTDGRTVTFQIQNLRAGWVGWQDSTPPTIQSDSARYDRTVGDDANINLRFHDSSGASSIPANSAGNYDYTTAEGKVVKVRQNSSKAVTGVSGYNTIGEELDDSKVLIPGTNYTVTNSTAEEQKAAGTNMGNAVIGGKVTEAGIYTVSVFAKDYDKLSNNTTWNQSGQEAHGSITVVVKPKVEVQNVETYSTTVPVKISTGATSAKVTMPDGTVTNLKAVNGKWLVDSGSTNTAVTENQELGAVDSNTVFNIPVTSEATAKVGVDNIKVEASVENVKGTFLRERVELNGTDGQKHTAVLNSTSGHWELPADYAESKTLNGDGTTRWTKRQVYTEAQQDGGMKFYIYEYIRQLDSTGKVTSVETPTRPETIYVSRNTNQVGDGMSVIVTYDKHSNTWASSDGTEVTATKLENDSWEVHTKSGFGGIIRGTIATNTDVATVVNTKPTATSQDYTSTKGTVVDLRNEAKAAVSISDSEDTKYGKTTYITRITVTSPSGVQKVFDTKQDANNYNIASGYSLNEVGVYTVKIDVIDSNGNYTTEATIGGTESGVDHGVDSSTATTTYHITVTDTIEGHNVTSTDIQGATQKETPTFTSVGDGSPVKPSAFSPAKLVDPKTGGFVDTLTIDGQGTYSINNETGEVTFVPLKTFTGTATPVTVSLTAKLGKDANDTDITATATATYSPTVIPVKPTSTDDESEGPKGQKQNGTPTFTGGKVEVNGVEKTVEIDENVKPTFDDGTTKKVIPGEGTYTIDENGVVTFTPEKDFVGKASGVTVKRVDKNGTEITAKYTPTVRPITSFVDTKGNTLVPTEDGEQPKKEIPGYRFVETKKLPNGDTEHVYEKVKTSHKDKEGNEIPGYPSEDGEQPKKEIPGYRFVETKKLPNGDTEHVYEKVKTSHKDKEGNEIPGYPTEDGEQPKKEIPGYRFVETKKLPNGDTEHIYEKVKTSFKDKEGKEIPGYPTEDGEQPKKDIPSYRFVETKKLPNGDTEHVYEKVKTSHKDKEGNEIPGYPTEDGEQPKKDIPGYRFVETKKLPNGDTEHVYEKVKTSHKDKEGNEIPGYPSEDGEQPKKDIPGYRFVETKKLPNGDTEHLYEKVKTSHKDKEGNEIPGYPTEDGEQPKKDIPGYRFVETKKLPNGDTEHVYEKVKTSHKDKEGNEIPGYPTEDGEQPKKDIPGYRFVETKKLPNGDTEHVYEKVKTSFKDKEGNEIPGHPTEDGEQPKKDIPGYRFVETKKLPNGDTE